MAEEIPLIRGEERRRLKEEIRDFLIEEIETELYLRFLADKRIKDVLGKERHFVLDHSDEVFGEPMTQHFRVAVAGLPEKIIDDINRVFRLVNQGKIGY